MAEPIAEQSLESSPNKNRCAEISFYSGIAGVLLCFAGPALAPLVMIAGFVTGIIALVQASRAPTRCAYVRQALVGIALSLVSFTLIGILYAMLSNMSEGFATGNEMRRITGGLLIDAQAHQGHLPMSISALGLAPGELMWDKYYFYRLHTHHPYLFNARLAGRNVDVLSLPERTVIIAPGKKMGATVFHSLADIDLEVRGSVACVDGHTESVSSSGIVDRAPARGSGKDDVLFIEPQEK